MSFGCCSRVNFHFGNWSDRLFHPFMDPALMKIRDLERELATASTEKKQIPYHAQIINLSFAYKRDHPEFKLTNLAKKTFEVAKEITKGEVEDLYILNHPREYAFLTGPFHYLHKHIRTLVDHWGVDAKVEIVEEELTFHTGEKVFEMLLESEEKDHQVFDLDQLSLGRRDEKQSCTKLRPNFQREGDGKHYLQIAIFNPEDTPTARRHHSWVRLIDANGEIISVGKYPEHLNEPNFYAMEPVAYRCSDEYEWLAMGKEKTYDIELTESEYKEVHAEILKTMRQQTSTTAPKDDFNVFVGKNCTDWVISIASRFIKIDREACRVDQLATILVFPKIYRFFEKNTPKWIKVVTWPIRKFFSILFHIHRLILYLFMGAFTRNPKNPDSTPLISHWTELFNDRLTMTTHPLYFNQWLEQNFKTAIKARQQCVDL